MPPSNSPLRRYALVQAKADREVTQIMQDALKDLEAEYKALEAKSGISATVRRAQISAARVATLRRLSAAWGSIGDVIQKRAVDASLAAAKANAAVDQELFDRLGLTAEQKRNFRRGTEAAARDAVDLALNHRTAGDTTSPRLSDRVYQSAVMVNGMLENKIRSAIARGISAAQFAKEMRNFIRPDVPGGASYAAKRLARTEINAAFHRAQVEDAKSKPWIKALHWRLSGSHPSPDICNKIAEGHSEGMPPGEYTPDETPDKPHPQCLCTLLPVTISDAEFEARMLERGFS